MIHDSAEARQLHPATITSIGVFGLRFSRPIASLALVGEPMFHALLSNPCRGWPGSPAHTVTVELHDRNDLIK